MTGMTKITAGLIGITGMTRITGVSHWDVLDD